MLDIHLAVTKKNMIYFIIKLFMCWKSSFGFLSNKSHRVAYTKLLSWYKKAQFNDILYKLEL